MKDMDCLGLHIKDLSKVQLLTPEEEAELVVKAQNGDKAARDRIITANMRFVIKVASKYQNRGIELEDLVSEGYLGLIEALNHFDVNRGYHFISYAVWWIRQSILKAIAEKGRAIRIPMNKINELNQIKKAQKQVHNSKITEEVELDEIAKMLGMTKYHVREMLTISSDIQSLDAPALFDDTGKITVGDTIESIGTDPVDYALNESLKNDIDTVLQGLDPKSREVLRLRYGLDDGECKSLAYIGEKFNLSKERIRQIENKAIKTLKASPKRTRAIADYVA